MSIRADTGINDKSQIIAGGDVQLVANVLDNSQPKPHATEQRALPDRHDSGQSLCGPDRSSLCERRDLALSERHARATRCRCAVGCTVHRRRLLSAATRAAANHRCDRPPTPRRLHRQPEPIRRAHQQRLDRGQAI
ncbi:hypothetical protein [Pararobbsia silviterrae]